MTYGEYCSLVDELNELAKAYSNGNSPVSDVAYDAKYRQIKEFEINNPDLVLAESPTQNVTEDLDDGFKKVEHDPEHPMVSITNACGIAEAVAWVKSTYEKYGIVEFELEYKLDGASLALTYQKGQLDDAVTRGKDNIGDSVIYNAVKIQGVRQHVDAGDLADTEDKRKDFLEVRGETLWKYDDFDEYNERMEAEGKALMSNPRNGAAGSLKLSSPKEVESRKLSYVAYIVTRGLTTERQSDDIEWLEKQGFEVPPHCVVDISGEGGLEAFRNAAEDMRSKRESLPYPIDGIVIKVNEKKWYKVLGYSSKAPNFYKAYKFPPEERVTVLRKIEESAGRSGAITPVAIFDPISLAMTNVNRSTIHNWELTEYLGLFEGCHIVVRKAGEIVPEIVGCVETGRTKDDYELAVRKGAVEAYVHKDGVVPYVRPSLCPYCGQPLSNPVNKEGKKLVAWVCTNPDCEAQETERLCNFADRQVMNIRGVGPSVIEELYVAGKLKTVADFYKLTESDFIDFTSCRAKSAKKNVAAIDKTRSNTLSQWVEGLGITGIGHTASPLIAKALHAVGVRAVVEALASMNLTTDQSEIISQFSRECIDSGITQMLLDRFTNYAKGHADLLMYFIDNNIAQEFKGVEVESNKLAGQSCIMTGVFDKLDRDVFKDMVVKNGGKVCSGISKNTTIVLMGDGAGPSKVAKIESLKAAGVKMRVFTPETLDEFMKLVE